MKKFNYADYHAKYNNTRYDRVGFFVPKGRKAIYKKAAATSGMSLSAWFIALAEKEVSKQTLEEVKETTY
ncbi:MAG: hypothetical protein II702_06655 [Clostridia bacterium]|nr:hypothetical protein [Clostridia bacterium]